MNEKSIRAPFMLAKLKFCRPAKAATDRLPNKRPEKLFNKDRTPL